MSTPHWREHRLERSLRVALSTPTPGQAFVEASEANGRRCICAGDTFLAKFCLEER
jgi:hypothetical protein